MKVEVEQKFAVDDFSRVGEQLAALGARFEPPVCQCDTYFAHPNRDFAATDEALRIRRDSLRAAITYKGPRLDSSTKTRRELELPLGPAGAAAGFAELLAALGFAPVADVRKSRREATLVWHGLTLHVALDEVEGLGRFVELEMVVANGQIGPAQVAVASLAEALGLSASQRRSYLELLLEKGK